MATVRLYSDSNLKRVLNDIEHRWRVDRLVLSLDLSAPWVETLTTYLAKYCLDTLESVRFYGHNDEENSNSSFTENHASAEILADALSKHPNLRLITFSNIVSLDFIAVIMTGTKQVTTVSIKSAKLNPATIAEATSLSWLHNHPSLQTLTMECVKWTNEQDSLGLWTSGIQELTLRHSALLNSVTPQLHNHTTLQKLTVDVCETEQHSGGVLAYWGQFPTAEVQKQMSKWVGIIKSIASILQDNSTMTELTLVFPVARQADCFKELYDALQGIARALKHNQNSSLQKLKMQSTKLEHFDNATLMAFVRMARRNRVLQELHLTDTRVLWRRVVSLYNEAILLCLEKQELSISELISSSVFRAWSEPTWYDNDILNVVFFLLRSCSGEFVAISS